MNCIELEEKLAEYLYDEVESHLRLEIERHLMQCRQCSAEFEALSKTMDRLDQWPALEEPYQGSPEMALAKALVNSNNNMMGRFSMFKSILTGSAAAILMFCVLEFTNVRDLITGQAEPIAGDLQQAATPLQGAVEEFILLLFEDREAASSISEDDEMRLIQEYSEWAGQLAQAGRLVGAEKLKNKWARVMSGSNQQFVMNEGFQTRENELISGFFHIRAESYDQAVDIAKSCPHLKYDGKIEMRWIESID